MATNKITKTMRNNDIIALLKGEEVQHGTTIADAIAHLERENKLIARKNSSTSPATKAKVQTVEAEKETIVGILAEQIDGMTATEIATAIGNGFSNQKAANRLKKLIEQGTVKKEIVKGKALFSLA